MCMLECSTDTEVCTSAASEMLSITQMLQDLRQFMRLRPQSQDNIRRPIFISVELVYGIDETHAQKDWWAVPSLPSLLYLASHPGLPSFLCLSCSLLYLPSLPVRTCAKSRVAAVHCIRPHASIEQFLHSPLYTKNPKLGVQYSNTVGDNKKCTYRICITSVLQLNGFRLCCASILSYTVITTLCFENTLKRYPRTLRQHPRTL